MDKNNNIFKIVFNDIKREKSLYISLILVIIISLIFGSLFITILSDSDRVLVSNSITTFFDSINNNTFIRNNYIFNNIINNNIYGLILYILGFSIIGIPILICMLFYKGFILAFTISSFIFTFKFDGILVSFIYIFPHLIINLFIYFILTYYSFNLSVKLFKKIINKDNFKLKFIIKKYIVILLISIIILSLTALYETYIMTYLIKFIY